MTQSIEYVVKVSGAQQAAGQVSLVEKTLKQTEVTANRAGAAVDRAVKPTRNLGQAGLEASRAIEDLQYGFNGIVNNIPSLVMGLGAGAGVAGAISLVAVGVNQLVKNWDSLSAALGSSELEFKAAQGAIADVGKAFDEQLTEQMDKARKTLKDLKDDLRDFGLTTRDKSLEEQARGIEDMERRLDNLRESRRFRQAAANKAESERDTERYREAKLILDEADRRAADLERSLKEARSIYIETAKTVAALRAKDAAEDERVQRERDNKRAARALKRAGEKIESGDDGAANRRLEREQRERERANEKALESQLKAEQKADRERMKAAQKVARAMDELREMEIEKLEEHLEQQRQAWRDFGMEFADLGIGMYGTVANAAQDYWDNLITGQEHAAEMLGISIMRSAGDSLVGSGIKLLGEGTVSAFTPGLQPLAAAQIGAGAGLIAAGMGLGAGATAIEHSMAGGIVGQKLDDKSTRDPGASPRSSGSGSGSGGPMIINVAYGAGGPLPEDIAREISRVVRSGDRRRGEA